MYHPLYETHPYGEPTVGTDAHPSGDDAQHQVDDRGDTSAAAIWAKAAATVRAERRAVTVTDAPQAQQGESADTRATWRRARAALSGR